MIVPAAAASTSVSPMSATAVAPIEARRSRSVVPKIETTAGKKVELSWWPEIGDGESPKNELVKAPKLAGVNELLTGEGLVVATNGGTWPFWAWMSEVALCV